MSVLLAPRDVEIRHWHLFCGLGGGKKGFNRATAIVGQARARLRCIGGIDVSAAAIADFDRMGPGRGTVLDLFTREQYRAFHGHEPPDGWRPATPQDIRRSAGDERPHIVFGSAPCKGFSGLLSEAKSKSAKYDALNQLALRGLWLALEAWKDDPPEFFLWENVPRIATRGRPVLDQMEQLFEGYGYAYAETTHDCGELGQLAQRRPRFLLVARHREKVPPFLYEPPKRRVRGVGEVIGKLPVPGPDLILPMHRLPRLQWQTWVRLAFVEAGSDWRSLNKLRVADGVLQDFRLAPDVQWHNGALGVRTWDEPSPCVTGNGRPMTGAFSVADPRIDGHERSVQHGVGHWEQPASVIKGDVSVGTGRYAIADPRYAADAKWSEGRRGLGVLPWDAAAGAVTSQGGPAQGTYSVADPRIDHLRNAGLGVKDWSEPAGVVAGESHPTNGAFAVADPRIPGKPRFANVYRIVPWDQPSLVVAGNGGPAMGIAVADPRPGFGAGTHNNILRVTEWDQASRVVTSGDHPSGGALCVADPRIRDGKPHYQTSGEYGVVPWDASTGSVTAQAQHDNGRWSVADPREPIADAPLALPGPTDRLVAVIQALDGTFHRPFTTLELALIQSLMEPDEILELHGDSNAAWRERIGNAVPPAAAQAIAEVMAQTLLLAWSGETFALSATPIWVRPIAVALSVQPIAPGVYGG